LRRAEAKSMVTVTAIIWAKVRCGALYSRRWRKTQESAAIVCFTESPSLN
jgi:hypothetical protein